MADRNTTHSTSFIDAMKKGVFDADYNLVKEICDNTVVDIENQLSKNGCVELILSDSKTRLSVAKNLLISSPESSISEIAHFTGFYDSAHFSKVFKQSFGMTAKEFRKEGYKAPHI